MILLRLKLIRHWNKIRKKGKITGDIIMRLLHTMLRVGNLQSSISFYTEILDMKLLRQKDYPDGRFTLAFVGYGDEKDNTVIELTHNWDTDQYSLEKASATLLLKLMMFIRLLKKSGSKVEKIIRDAGPMNAGTTIIAFVEDPDGYQIELLNAKS